MIETVAEALEAIVRRSQVTVAVHEHVPWLGEAETKVTVAGRLSSRVTPRASRARRWRR